MLTIIILVIHHNGRHDNHGMVPHWARITFLHFFARICGMSRYITSDKVHELRIHPSYMTLVDDSNQGSLDEVTGLTQTESHTSKHSTPCPSPPPFKHPPPPTQYKFRRHCQDVASLGGSPFCPQEMRFRYRKKKPGFDVSKIKSKGSVETLKKMRTEGLATVSESGSTLFRAGEFPSISSSSDEAEKMLSPHKTDQESPERESLSSKPENNFPPGVKLLHRKVAPTSSGGNTEPGFADSPVLSNDSKLDEQKSLTPNQNASAPELNSILPNKQYKEEDSNNNAISTDGTSAKESISDDPGGRGGVKEKEGHLSCCGGPSCSVKCVLFWENYQSAVDRKECPCEHLKSHMNACPCAKTVSAREGKDQKRITDTNNNNGIAKKESEQDQRKPSVTDKSNSKVCTIRDSSRVCKIDREAIWNNEINHKIIP